METGTLRGLSAIGMGLLLLAGCEGGYGTGVPDYAEALETEVAGLREDYDALNAEFRTFREEWGSFYSDWGTYREEAGLGAVEDEGGSVDEVGVPA